MLIESAKENLAFPSNPPKIGGISALLLRFEAWLAWRASARALYHLDDRALSDIALSRSDVACVNASAGWAFWRRPARAIGSCRGPARK